MNWYEKFIVPLWKEYKIWGFVIVVAVLLVVLVVAALVLGVDVGGYINNLLGVKGA